jgi:hypothetical protein
LRKSGTSFVKNLLDGHPELFVWPPNELHLFRYSDHAALVRDKKRICQNLQDLKHELSRQRFITRQHFESRAEQGTLQDLSGYRRHVDVEQFLELVDRATVTSYKEIYEVLFRAMAKASRHFAGDVDNVRFVSKSVLETEYLPELVRWFPDLKFVYVLRNPYGHFNAVRNSMRRRDGSLGRFSPPYPYLGREIATMQGSYYFMLKWRDLYPEQFHILVYDRLLDDPEPHLRELCRFLGIEPHETLMTPTLCGEPWSGNSWYKGFDGIDKSPLTHWMGDISGGEIRLINTHFANVFDEFGFERIESRTSRLVPFHPSERPINYLANRALFMRSNKGANKGKRKAHGSV